MKLALLPFLVSFAASDVVPRLQVSREMMEKRMKGSIPKISSLQPKEDRQLQDSTLLCIMGTFALTDSDAFTAVVGSPDDLFEDEMNLERNCVLGFDGMKCYLDNTSTFEAAVPVCAGMGGSAHKFQISIGCNHEDGQMYTHVGMVGCLSPFCSSLEEFIDNVDQSMFPDDDEGLDATTRSIPMLPESVEGVERAEDQDGECIGGEQMELGYWKGLEESLYCTDTDEEAFFRMKGDKVKTTTCRKLAKLSMEKKSKICTKESKSPDVLSAKEACPKTCCECGEDPDAVFFQKKKKNEEGEKVPRTKTCSFLYSLAEKEEYDKVYKYCSMKKGYAPEKIPPARYACNRMCDMFFYYGTFENPMFWKDISCPSFAMMDAEM